MSAISGVGPLKGLNAIATGASQGVRAAGRIWLYAPQTLDYFDNLFSITLGG